MDFLTEELLYQKTSQQLTSMLYEKAILNIEESIEHIHNKDFYTANESLKNTSDILHRLGVGLKYEAGVIAEQLDTIYNYVAERVVEGNMKKDITILQDAHHVLTEISAAWNKAMSEEVAQKRPIIRRKLSSYESQISTTTL
ncbi:flagellar export chaperone FliS [Priestia flexa]|uniref:flagellar export chaperone FliS n=1 Tax=Priestia flexa TaxID=86664 RepID=UPI001FF7F7E2|nr:flagellar export chaperone FliS [Priestia flexa]